MPRRPAIAVKIDDEGDLTPTAWDEVWGPEIERRTLEVEAGTAERVSAAATFRRVRAVARGSR